jgi:DNA-3-methyladenine glycosylase II
MYIAVAEQQLTILDPVLGALIAGQQLAVRPLRTDYFSSLCRAIVGQQVSVAAAAAIYKRLEQQTAMLPERVVTLDDQQVKEIGLSRQKSAYIHDLAQHFTNTPAVYSHLETLSDEYIISELTAVKGIGVWTAQMFLMFTLGRPDVFAPEDIGLQRAIINLYGLESKPTKRELESYAAAWKPYRTVASLHLWQSLDNTPT